MIPGISKVRPLRPSAFLDVLVTSPSPVIPDLLRGPEGFDYTGFPSQFAPDLIQGGNDEKRLILTLYDCIFFGAEKVS